MTLSNQEVLSLLRIGLEDETDLSGNTESQHARSLTASARRVESASKLVDSAKDDLKCSALVRSDNASGNSVSPAQNNTFVRKGGFPVSAELTSTGGLLRGERHLISGMTAGETAPSPPETDLPVLVSSKEDRIANKVAPKLEDKPQSRESISSAAENTKLGQAGEATRPTDRLDNPRTDSRGGQFISLSDLGLLLLAALPE